MQENDDEYDDNELPAVASGLVNSVLKNVNNQIISGTIDMDISNNDNVCMDTSNPSESVNVDRSLQIQISMVNEDNSNESTQPVVSRISPTIIPEIESAMKEISGLIDNFMHPTDNNTSPEASPGNSPNKSQVNGIDGVNQNESVASMSSNVIPTNYSQDSFDVSVKDPGVPSVAEMDDKTQELDLQRNRSGLSIP